LNHPDMRAESLQPEQPTTLSASKLWREIGYRPLVQLTVALILGVLAAEHGHISLSLPLLLGLGAATVGFMVLRGRSAYAHLWLAVAFFCAGVCLHATEFVLSPTDISNFAPAAQAHIEGHIAEAPKTRPHWRGLVVQVSAVEQDGWRWPASGCVSLSESDPQQPVIVGQAVAVDIRNLRLPAPALNLGQLDFRRYLARRGITASAQVRQLRLLAYPPPRFKLARTVELARQQALNNFRRAMPERDANLMAGMVYGSHAVGTISEQTEDLFRRTGTIHLLVVSGAQVTFIVFALILLITARRRWPLRPWHALLIGPPVVAFALLAGLGPSVSRSVVMAAILIYALVTQHRYDLPNALALGAFVLVVADTNVVFDVGAQLTFAATIGVALYSPRSRRDLLGIIHRPHLVTVIFFATVGAWVMVTPILAHSFYSFAGLGNLANVIAVPISMIIVPLGMIALITGSVMMPITRLLCGIVRLLIEIMVASNKFFAALPGAYLDNIFFPWPVVLAWYIGLGGILLVAVHPALRQQMRQLWQRLNKRWVVPGGLVAIAVIAVLAVVASAQTGPLRVTFLAVGEGQCAVIQAPNGQTVMIDAGSRTFPGGGNALADRVIVPFLSRRGIRHLTTLIITHPHADHCNAVPRLLERIPVDFILDPGLGANTQTYRAVRQTALVHGVPAQLARAGGRLRLDDGVEATLLAPSEPLLAGTADDMNNNSVCLRVTYGQTSFLFLADQQQEGLQRLIRWAGQQQSPLASTVVQLPHHGRHLGEAQPVLALARPQWCIMSGGQALASIQPMNLPRRCEILPTAQTGMITLTTDGRQVRVQTFRER